MQIYALHMESHQQRMGILSRYVETANYSLGEDADGTERDLWSSNKFKWKMVLDKEEIQNSFKV